MTFATNPRLRAAKRYALIIIDMSVGFTDPGVSPLGAESTEVLGAIEALLQKFRALDLPVVYTTVVYDDQDEAAVFREKIPQLNCLERANGLHGIDPRVAPRDNEKVIIKKWASAFFGTELDACLKDADVDGVIVTGLTTSGCVRATVVDAIQSGYRPLVVDTATGDRDTDAHRANLRDISIKYGDVVTLAEAMAVLDKVHVNAGLGA
ncbi:MAG TPA: isochorismatase family protein [Marinobacter sp.]|nr:isochorismatase family protein [Marinobacter sp.]